MRFGDWYAGFPHRRTAAPMVTEVDAGERVDGGGALVATAAPGRDHAGGDHAAGDEQHARKQRRQRRNASRLPGPHRPSRGPSLPVLNLSNITQTPPDTRCGVSVSAPFACPPTKQPRAGNPRPRGESELSPQPRPLPPPPPPSASRARSCSGEHRRDLVEVLGEFRADRVDLLRA